jgi:hypothetical protein
LWLFFILAAAGINPGLYFRKQQRPLPGRNISGRNFVRDENFSMMAPVPAKILLNANGRRPGKMRSLRVPCEKISGDDLLQNSRLR